MANYSITAASARPSVYAIYLQPNPAYTSTIPAVPLPCFAGTTITAGMPVYVGTDSLIYPADANGADPLYKCVGIAVNGAAANQPVYVVTKDPQFTPGCTLAVGDTLIVSGTAGAIAPDSDKAAGFFNTVLGVAYSTTQMNLNPTRADAVKI